MESSYGSPASSGWLRAQMVWLIPFVGISIAYAVQQLVARFFVRGQKQRREKDEERDESKPRTPGGREHEISPFARTTFDLGGSLITPSRVALEKVLGNGESLQGLINLGIVLGLFQLTYGAIKNYMACEALICDPYITTALFNLRGPLVAFLGFGCYYLFGTFLFAKLVIVQGVLPRRYEPAAQGALEASLFLGMILFIRFQTHWALLQRLSLGMEAFVLAAKQHSYLVRNRALRDDKEAGGSGEGEFLAIIRSKLITSSSDVSVPLSSKIPSPVAAEEQAAPAASHRPAGDEANAEGLPVLRLRKQGLNAKDAAPIRSLSSTGSASTVAVEAAPPRGPYGLLMAMLKRFWTSIRNQAMIEEVLISSEDFRRHFATWKERHRRRRAAASQSSSGSNSSSEDGEATASSEGGRKRPASSPRGSSPKDDGSQSLQEHDYSTVSKDDGDSLGEDNAAAAETIRRDPSLMARLFGAAGTPAGSTKPGLLLPAAELRQRCAEGKETEHTYKQLEDGTILTYDCMGRVAFLTPQAYPDNVNFKDFVRFSAFPTLTYQPSFFRTPEIRIPYVLEKIFLIAGLLFACVTLVQDHIQPALKNILSEDPFLLILRTAVPVTLLNVLVFYISFEVLLNAAAELTCFGSRAFYGPWWNSTSFIQFSRLWNFPVHKWLLKEVYLESMRSLALKPFQALFLTFGVSIVLHELILWAAISPAWSVPYLGLLSLLQFPLIPLMKTEPFRGKLLGNLLFWSFLAIGLAMSVVLYGYSYCSAGKAGVCGKVSV